MDEQTKQLLIEHMERAPSDIRELLLSDMLTDDILSISTKYSLSEAQRDSLQTEVRLVLLGVTELDQFTENIRDELGIDNKTTTDMVVDVDKAIFSLVRDSLNVINGYASLKDTVKEVFSGKNDIPTPPHASPIADPVVGSILGDNRRPGAQSDPYREPIDEE